jgi:DNA-binding SARP family transcriptional activator/TolB-like protein
VEANVVAAVENCVESTNSERAASSLRIGMLGPLKLLRDGVPVALPASRKVRALLAFLALSPHAVTRSHLCELLWDVPNDPRGELRWCLSKLRGLIDEPGRRRVRTGDDSVRLDLGGCFVDVLEVARATASGLESLDARRLRSLSALFAGDFVEGLEIERSPMLETWLTAQRRRFRASHAAVLGRLVDLVDDEEALDCLDQIVRLAPFDRHAHEKLLNVLARRGRIQEGEEHVAATMRLFEAEGLDGRAVRDAWRAVRSRPIASQPSTPASNADVPPVSVEPAQPDAADPTRVARRASIAVMPFADRSDTAAERGGAADALAHDVITRLAKLRSLFVIAQGTVFALHERHVAPEEAGRLLHVDYVVSGSVRRDGKRFTVAVELAETRTGRIVWAETFNRTQNDAFAVLDEIGNRIVASVASEIETLERNRAILRPPSSLDAWEAHHRGLWHMYRFNQADNGRAKQFFEMAVRLDPTFARAHAGLSFTHFQEAFQGWGERRAAVDRAFETAGQSLMADDRDPAAHWAMGRALWLRGRHGASIEELERTIDLSPNFALGHYTLAFVHSQAGDPAAAIAFSDHSRELSPFDPLLFAMLGARAMALARLQRFDDAVESAIQAASRPNAHAHIQAIAAYCLGLAGRNDEAREHLARIHRTMPGYGIDDFLRAMQFTPDGEQLFRQSAKVIGSR